MTKPRYRNDLPDLADVMEAQIKAAELARLPQQLGSQGQPARGEERPRPRRPGTSPARYVLGQALKAYQDYLRGTSTSRWFDGRRPVLSRLAAAQARVAEMDADERRGPRSSTPAELATTGSSASSRMRLRLLAIPIEGRSACRRGVDYFTSVEKLLGPLVEEALAELEIEGGVSDEAI